MKKISVLSYLVLLSPFIFSSCTPYQTQGAMTGGMIGAATGAVVGNDSESILKGAVIGAAGGAAVAAVNEQNSNAMQTRNSTGNYPDTTNQPSPSNYPQESMPSGGEVYPTARKTNRPDVVISPYDPTRQIGVKGYNSGDLVRDPKNNKIFRVP